MSHVMCQVSHVAFHLSPLTCHMSLTPKTTEQTLFNRIPPKCTVLWFALTQKPKSIFFFFRKIALFFFFLQIIRLL